MQEIVDRLGASDRAADIARTLLLPYLNHAATMYESGYATHDDIDAAMRFGCGYPIGPLTLIDTLGPQAVATGLDKLYAETGDDAAPAREHPDPDGRRQHDLRPGLGEDDVDQPQLRHEIETVGVVGTGTMASGIVEVFAKSGYDVVYVGRSADKLAGVEAAITKSLDKAISRGKLDEDGKSAVLARLSGSTEREALAGADIIVEAIAEDLDIKLELFRDLDRIAKPGAILATTTSSLSITSCAEVDVASPGRHRHALLQSRTRHEARRGRVRRRTTPEVAETVRALCLSTGKHPVSCGDRAASSSTRCCSPTSTMRSSCTRLTAAR